MQSSVTTACRRSRIATNFRTSPRCSRRSSDGARQPHSAHPTALSRTTCTTGTSSPRARSSWRTSGEYSTPCGATLAGLLTAAHRHFMHDPEVYKDPMEFNPDRLVAQPGKPAEPDPFNFAFGYGRRGVSHAHHGRDRRLLHPCV